MTSAEKRSTRASICKEMHRLLRRRCKNSKRDKIGKILRDFRGLKKIADIKVKTTAQQITCMQDPSGADQTDRKLTADVFATFYE